MFSEETFRLYEMHIDLFGKCFFSVKTISLFIVFEHWCSNYLNTSHFVNITKTSMCSKAEHFALERVPSV